MQEDDESLVWYRAVTLAERLVSGPPSAAGSSPDKTENVAARQDDAALEHRLSRWKTQKPFGNAERFAQRLGLDNLTEGALRQLLAESPAELRSRLREAPPWVASITSALTSGPTFEFHAFLTDRLRTNPTIGFLDVAAPFISPALRRLEDGAATLARQVGDSPFDPTRVGSLFFPGLARTLLGIVSRTLVLELNVARLEGRLAGATPRERFDSFVLQLHDPARLRAFFEEYPVLARLLAEHTDRWISGSLELLERLSADRGVLQQAFAKDGSLGSLVKVSGGLADTHSGGRSVAILRFDSGTRVLYKPKSLAVDLHFQDALLWLDTEGFEPGFRRLTIVDRGDYGWTEFVSPETCLTRDDVTRFYERIGGLIALLYVVDATDLHAGNIIAAGEHPMLIDLEALFHPHRSVPTAPRAVTADRAAARVVRDSVLRIGLLPERHWGNSEHEGVDISGLGAPEGQVLPHAVAAWEESGTDTMRLVRKRKPVETEHNRPTLSGQPVDPTEYREAIFRGFRSAYSLLAARRDVLLSPEGPVHRCADDSVSVFLRGSRTYRRLLRESYHPDVLRDALDRDRLFDLLWMEVDRDEDLARVLRSELDDLSRGDIPRFTARPGSRHVWHEGHEPLADFLPAPSLAAVQRIVDRLGDEDGARQAWFIEASLATLPGADKGEARYRSVPATAPRNGDRLLTAASAMGDRLEQLAIRGTDDASWIGLQRERRSVWSIDRAGLDLDAGLPGIALFLAYLGAVTGRESYAALAGAALAAMRRSVRARGPSRIGIGGFDGLGGVIYALSHLGALWGRTDLLLEANELTRVLPPLIDADEDLDVFGGSAGCVLALRSLHRCLPSDQLTAVAVQCGHTLLAAARPASGGADGPGRLDGATPGCGLVFGTEGIAHALLELHAWTGIDRFRAAALGSHAALVAHEPQSRSDGDASRRTGDTSWCPSGGAGVALSRLFSAADKLDTPVARADLSGAVQAVRAHGFGRNHSLWHGDFGSLELLERAAVELNDADMAREAGGRMSAILDSIEQHGWRCGTPLGVETPGLLAGLAGIGYGMLRSARPDIVPSVLALEAPIAQGAHGRRPE